MDYAINLEDALTEAWESDEITLNHIARIIKKVLSPEEIKILIESL